MQCLPDYIPVRVIIICLLYIYIYIYIAVCSAGCYSGVCVNPDTCQCDAGYTGHTCGPNGEQFS